MTPYEYSLALSAYNKRTKFEQQERITMAYMTAYWQRVKPELFPSLREVLGKDTAPAQEPQEQQSAVDMLEEIKRLNAAFGGETIG